MAGLPDFVKPKPQKTDIVVALPNVLLRELDKFRPVGVSRPEIIRQIIKQTILGSKPSDRRRGKIKKKPKRLPAKSSGKRAENKGQPEDDQG